MIYLYKTDILPPLLFPLPVTIIFCFMWSERKRIKYFEALKKNEILKEVEEKDLLEFLDLLTEDVLPKNTCSLNNLKTSNNFHFIISGRLKSYQIDNNSGRELTFFILKQGDVFDILCLLDGCEHDIYYESLERVVLLTIPMAEMKIWLREHPSVNKNLLPYLGRQIRTLEEYASSVTLINISTRLARLILKNINSESQELELINDLSNEEIANLIGSTRAVVNRHLQEFKQDGIITIGRQKVVIKDLNLLLDKAKGKYSS